MGKNRPKSAARLGLGIKIYVNELFMLFEKTNVCNYTDDTGGQLNGFSFRDGLACVSVSLFP